MYILAIFNSQDIFYITDNPDIYGISCILVDTFDMFYVFDKLEILTSLAEISQRDH